MSSSDREEKDDVNIILSHECDWKQRALNAERGLSTELKKNEHSHLVIRKLRGQLNEYCEALGRSTQDCSSVMGQCRALADTNLRLDRECQKAKLMVETLEAVLVMFYTHPSAKEISQTHQRLTGREPSNEERPDSASA